MNVSQKSMYMEFPYANGPDIDKRLIEYEKALNAPQSAENRALIEENMFRLRGYRKLPERLQEAYYEKEKHLYGLSQNLE